MLQLPFVAAVAVQVALVGLPQDPALHANVADPVRQEAVFAKVALEPELVLLAVPEQPPPHSSDPEQGGFGIGSQISLVPPHAPSHRHL